MPGPAASATLRKPPHSTFSALPHTHISFSRHTTAKHYFKWYSSATESYKSFFQVGQWPSQALLMGTAWANSDFCWQQQGLSPSCWEEDGGRSQKPVQALAGLWQLTFLPRPTHIWVYSTCCPWLFWLLFPSRLPLCHLHKLIHEYLIPQNLDGEIARQEKKPAILNSVEKQVIDSMFK